MPLKEIHKQNIRRLLDNFVATMPLEYNIKELHKDRIPNSQLSLPLGTRLDVPTITFNLANLVLDILLIDSIDSTNIQYILTDRMYLEAQYYIQKIQQILDRLQNEFTIHTYMPSYFAPIGYTNVFGLMLLINDYLSTLMVDGKEVETYDGVVLLEEGEHVITLDLGDLIYDITWTLFSPQMVEPIYKLRTATELTVYAPTKTVLLLYKYKTKDTELPYEVSDIETLLPLEYIQAPIGADWHAPIIIDNKLMVMNYYYSLAEVDNQVKTIVYASDYIRPLVCVEFLKR